MMINGKIIDAALKPLFKGAAQTEDLYSEVKHDVQEAATDLLEDGKASSEQAAVKKAIADFGDLKEVIALVSGTQAAAPQTVVTADVLHEFEVDTVETIALSANFGTVKVINSTDEKLHVAQYQKPVMASYALQMRHDGKRLQLNVPTPSWLSFVTPFRHPHSQVVLAIPAGFQGTLQITGGSSSIYVQDVLAQMDVQVDLKSGSMWIQDSQVTNCKARLTSGTLKVNGLTAAHFLAEAKSGSVKLSEVSAAFDIRVHSGTINGDSLRGSGRFSAHSGMVKIAWDQLDGDSQFKAKSGSVKVWLPRTTDFAFDLQTRSGAAKVQHPAHYDLQVQGAAVGRTAAATLPMPKIIGRTHSGMISLKAS